MRVAKYAAVNADVSAQLVQVIFKTIQTFAFASTGASNSSNHLMLALSQVYWAAGVLVQLTCRK
jgi:hypothetical protein